MKRAHRQLAPLCRLQAKSIWNDAGLFPDSGRRHGRGAEVAPAARACAADSSLGLRDRFRAARDERRHAQDLPLLRMTRSLRPTTAPGVDAGASVVTDRSSRLGATLAQAGAANYAQIFVSATVRVRSRPEGTVIDRL